MAQITPKDCYQWKNGGGDAFSERWRWTGTSLGSSNWVSGEHCSLAYFYSLSLVRDV